MMAIGEEAVAEEQLTYHGQFAEYGDGSAEGACGGGGGQLTNAAGQLGQGAAEEVAKAHAEGGQRQTGHVLVGAQGNGKHAVNQRAQSAHQQAAQQGNQQTHEGDGVGGAVFVQERADEAGNAAHVHQTGNTKVEVAALFGEDLTVGAQQKRDALRDGFLQKYKNQTHAFTSSLLRLRNSRR